MDDIDLKILEELKRNGRATASDISKAVSLSVPATAERIRKMERSGIIEGYLVKVNRKALEKAGLTVDDIDLFEDNEAFAAQSVAVGRELKIPEEKLNVNGGAIALGHPIGASGARILITLIYEMKKRGAHKGLATLCIGGGMGTAMIVEM